MSENSLVKGKKYVVRSKGVDRCIFQLDVVDSSAKYVYVETSRFSDNCYGFSLYYIKNQWILKKDLLNRIEILDVIDEDFNVNSKSVNDIDSSDVNYYSSLTSTRDTTSGIKILNSITEDHSELGKLMDLTKGYEINFNPDSFINISY